MPYWTYEVDPCHAEMFWGKNENVFAIISWYWDGAGSQIKTKARVPVYPIQLINYTAADELVTQLKAGASIIVALMQFSLNSLVSALEVSTHWGRDKMDAIKQTTFSNAFSWMNIWTSVKISLKFAPKGPINNVPGLAEIMAWRRPGDKPLSEPMVASLLTHIWVSRPQWVKSLRANVLYSFHEFYQGLTTWTIYQSMTDSIFTGNKNVILVFFSNLTITHNMAKWRDMTT